MDLTGIDRLSISSFNALVVKILTKNEEADVDSCGRFSVGKCYQVCLPKHFIFSIRLLFMKKKPLFTTPEELSSTKSECFVNI